METVDRNQNNSSECDLLKEPAVKNQRFYLTEM